MRIVSGRFKGRLLKGPVGSQTRPTSDRLRETIFSVLHSMDAPMEKVLDLFAGTGALGFEALSRGSESVVFVEQNPLMCKNIHETRQTFGLSPQEAVILRKDATLPLPCTGTFDLVFCDPPYGKGLVGKSLRAQQKFFSPTTIFVIEQGIEEDPPSHLVILKEKEAGAAKVFFCSQNAEETPSADYDLSK